MNAADISKCRSCGAAVRFVVNAKGNRQIVDAAPSANGNLVFDERQKIVNGHYEHETFMRFVAPLLDSGQPLYVDHHATCPQADRWRR